MRPTEAGDIVGGKYKLTRPLGRGSMGEVWVAHHETLGEEVAIKLLTPPPTTGRFEESATAAARFRFEAQIAARLSRKTRHIVRVTDHVEENGLAYLVMELLEGRTLENCLMMYGAMPPDAVSRLVAQIARALEHAHAESVVHRDLKPANLFVARDEDGAMLVKVLDFGIARAIRTQRMSAPFSTGEGLVFGTPGYMSPEQACGAKLDSRADLWALATVAYEALTGDLPLPGAFPDELLRSLHAGRIVPAHERKPELPAGLAEFFRQAFAPRIEHRFSSATQLARAFERSMRIPGASEPAKPVFIGRARQGDTRRMAEVRPPASKGSSLGARAVWPRRIAIAVALAMLGGGSPPLPRTRAGALLLPVTPSAPIAVPGAGAGAEAEPMASTPESTRTLEMPAPDNMVPARSGQASGPSDRIPNASERASDPRARAVEPAHASRQSGKPIADAPVVPRAAASAVPVGQTSNDPSAVF